MNILIVDDEIDILEDIKYYVEKYERCNSVVACINPLEALEECKKNHFDIALLDIEMPLMNGLELADRLLSIFSEIKIVFITAYNNYAAEAFDVNAVDYILKPVRKERLFKSLDKLVYNQVDVIEKEKNKSELYVQTFGKFVVRNGQETIKWNRQKSFELFAYLLQNRGIPIHKEKLCDLLWQELDLKKALVNLQTTIYSIKKIFEKYNNNEISIEYSGSSYILTTKRVFIDSIEFEKKLKEAVDLKDVNLLKKTLRMYHGHYLNEEGWLWAETRREELRKKYVIFSKKMKDINSEG